MGVDTDLAVLEDLRRQLRKAWCAQSAADPALWSVTRPSTGQCAVSALIVQERFGGRILRVLVPGGSHYYNDVGGVDVDLTRDQFDEYLPTAAPEERTRGHLLANASTAARYRLLRDRLRDVEWDV